MERQSMRSGERKSILGHDDSMQLAPSAPVPVGWGIHDDDVSPTISARDLLPGTCFYFYPVADHLSTRYW